MIRRWGTHSFFQQMATWLREGGMNPADFHVSIKPATAEAAEAFAKLWAEDHREEYRRAGHHNPEAVKFSVSGLNYGIPVTFEGQK